MPNELTNAITVDGTATGRKITVNTESTSLTRDAAYSITVTAKTPTASTAIAGATLTISLTVGHDAACEPPAGVVASTMTAQSYQLGASAMTIQYPEFTYTTSPANRACALTYVSSGYSAISRAVTASDSARQLVVSTSSAAAAGTYTITVGALTPAGTRIPRPKLTFDLKIRTLCDPPGSVIRAAIKPQTAPLSGTSTSFTWAAWTSENPSGCTFTYTCDIPTAISRAVTVDVTTRTVTVNSRQQLLAGDYILKITALSESGDALTGVFSLAQPLKLLGAVTLQDKIVSTVSGVAVTASVAHTARNLARMGPPRAPTSGGRRVTRPGASDFTQGPSGGRSSQGTGRGSTTIDGASAGTSGSTTGTEGSTTGGSSTGTGDVSTVDGGSITGGDPADAPSTDTSAPGPDTFSGGEDTTFTDGDMVSAGGANSFDFDLDNKDGEYGDLDL